MGAFKWSVSRFDGDGYVSARFATEEGAGRAANHGLKAGDRVLVRFNDKPLPDVEVLNLAFAYERAQALEEARIKAEAADYPSVPSVEECEREAERARFWAECDARYDAELEGREGH